MQQKYVVQQMSSVCEDIRTATLNCSNNTWLGLKWTEPSKHLLTIIRQKCGTFK